MKRQGKNIIGIRFLIQKQNKTENSKINLLEKASDESHLHLNLKENYGFSNRKISDLLLSYSEEYLLEKIEIIESSASYRNGKIDNLGRYLEKALKDDFRKPKTSRVVIDKNRIEKENEEKVKKMNEENIRKYHNYQNNEFSLLFQALPEKDKLRIKIEKEFEAYINKT